MARETISDELRLADIPTGRWPAEWEPHCATWLSWPHNRETWPQSFDLAERCVAEIATALAPEERVRIGCGELQRARAEGALRDAGAGPLHNQIDWVPYPTHDAWVRDHGPIFLLGTEGALALDFRFDNWGQKYPGWELDDAVPQAMASFLDMPRHPISFVLEGGSIDGNGAGSVLTTESCLLHPNRGSGRTRARCASVLEAAVQAESLIWLAGGIEGDDTDGHVDDVARFVARDHIVAVRGERRGDPDFEILEENWSRLGRARDAWGRRFALSALPTPPPLYRGGSRLPASYANFYMANGVVLVPVFGVPSDESALRVLADALPDRRVVPIRCDALVEGLGAIHCCTKEEPEPVLEGASEAIPETPPGNK